MDNGPGTYAWKLKHQLLIKMVREKGDYKLDEINRQVAEILKGKNNGQICDTRRTEDTNGDCSIFAP